MAHNNRQQQQQQRQPTRPPPPGITQRPPQMRAAVGPAPPSMPIPRATPPPPGALRSASQRITGSDRQIRGSRDPLNKENQTGSKSGETHNCALSGVNLLVLGVLAVVAFAAIFVLPPQLKIFWVSIMGLTVLATICLVLYATFMEYSKEPGHEGYAEWAGFVLYGVMVFFTAVMVGLLVFMSWALYSLGKTKTNVLDQSNDENDEFNIDSIP